MKRRHPGTARIAGPKGTPVAPVLAAAALAAAVLALSGCQSFSPMQTNVAYQPADGVAVDLGDVQIRDLLVVSAARGEIGTLSGLMVNTGEEAATITFATGPDSAARAFIPAGGQARLSGAGVSTPVTLPSIDAAPGDMITVIVSMPAAGAPQVSVPVLPPTGYYTSLTPAPVTTTPEPVPTPTPEPVPTTPAPAQTTPAPTAS